MIRVRHELEQAGIDERLRRDVHALPRETHPPSDLRHGQGSVFQRDRAEHLPTR
jgi:hypothetical protein